MKRILIAALILSSLKAAWSAQAPLDLYKEAQLQENTARDPDAAIKLYEEFLKQPGSDRSVQANALLHLGLCHAKIGRTDAAKKSWKEIVQNYSDQSDSYAEGLNQLQKVQAAERLDVKPSTPIIRVVYSPPVTRWVLDFPRVSFNSTLDGKNELMASYAGAGSLGFSYFFRSRLGLSLEVGKVGWFSESSYDQNSQVFVTAERTINYIMPLVRAETPFWGPFAVYGKAGIGAYNFKFRGSSFSTASAQEASKWTPGMMSEVGVVIGWYRGLTINIGYDLHAFGQATPPAGFFDSLGSGSREAAPSISQNHGIRLVGGPVLGLAFRW